EVHEMIFAQREQKQGSTYQRSIFSFLKSVAYLKSCLKSAELILEIFALPKTFLKSAAFPVQEEVESLQQVTKGGRMEDALAAKTQAVEELSRELEEIRAVFGTEGVHQLQDFEAALKQRDGIITQLTTNLQQARDEKDEIMKEFLELTEQSQNLHIQFQQLQAGETLRNTSHSSAAADLLQARQQLLQYQPQLEELQLQLSQMEHELSLTLLREELAHVGRTTDENIINPSDEKDLIIAEQERVISERDCSLTQLEDELESSERRLRDLQRQMAAKDSELEKSCKGELSASRHKERMSSNEIMQLMGTVEDLQKRCHQGSLSEGDTIQQMQGETLRRLELLRAELDEMYGQQIVQMKREVNLQHAAKVEQMTEQHRAELELLKAQQLSQSSTVCVEVDTLNAKIRELQETLEQSQAMQHRARQELSQLAQEKVDLQAKVEDLLEDLRSAKEKVEQVSHSLVSQESQQVELRRLQEATDNLKSELAAAQKAAQEAEVQHDSETTNYKIKLEMLEREKDAVLDRMAQSQEAELDRLRTLLLFSHEEELTLLREDLQRENFLNTENLLNEAAIKHEKASATLRSAYEDELHLLRREKAEFATERDELFHQIVGLKEDLKLALHSSKADELVQQLQELQVELDELRKGGGERARMEREIQSLHKNAEMLDSQTKERELCWESKRKQHQLEKEALIESNKALKEELNSKVLKIESLVAENNKIQQRVVRLGEEIETQRSTFSFAEKNFEVNYQELKEEYKCLIEAKTQLEERTLKETLEFEAKIASLQSQVRALEESGGDLKMEDVSTDGREQAVIEKDTTELMEKLNVSLSENERLAERLSEATDRLMFTESKVGRLEEELARARQANVEVAPQSQSPGKELQEEQDTIREQTFGEDAQRKAKSQPEERAAVSLFRFLSIKDKIDYNYNFDSYIIVFAAFRDVLRNANEKLSQVLVDVLKTTAAAEETMGLHMQSLRDAFSGAQQAAPPESTTPTATRPRATTGPARSHAAGKSDQICFCIIFSLWSGDTDDGQQMMERLLLCNEEYLMGISRRLQTALEKMLMAITDTTNQLEHARLTQTELMRESFRHNQEMSELLQKQEELQERLSEEARAREQLALELHHAEDLIDGYTGERAGLEEQLRQKEELQLSLEQELQVSRLHELEQERLQMQDERDLLSRQQDAMREHAGPHLLEETEKLMKEKVDVQRQAEKENADLLKQVKLLEAELEEQVNRVIELENAQSTESGDLRQQVQALEKQLDKNRRFLDEQAVDREHERDVFQQEIQKLEEQLRNPQKLQAGSEQRNKEVDQLTSQLKEKADWCSELLLSSEQQRREVGERDEEIDKLESRIRELEQALLASADSLEKVRRGRREGGGGRERKHVRESQREQLEQFREELENKGEEVQQLHMQLEIQRKEISSQQQYLETKDSMLQVMEEKDREIALLNEQITKLQHTGTSSDNKEIDERDELIKDFESQVECLRSEQERLKRNSEEELDQLNAVIDRLQQELANIEQKPSAVGAPSKEEYDEMKQRMDMATGEINTLKTKHTALLETYLRLKESAEALAETESAESELEDALREKTAGLVVMQAQVQALEQSATSKVEELDLRIRQLEVEVGEKDSELSRCLLLLEQTRSHAADLQQRVSNLEENLRENLDAALVNQAPPEAFQQQQSKESEGNQDLQSRAEPDVHGIGQTRQAPKGKVVHLTQRLRELEVGLSGIQKDQELQKQLLSSSEEEVLEYERRLSVLMDLLGQMKAGPPQKTPPTVGVRVWPITHMSDESRTNMAELLQEAASTKEELNTYKQHNKKLLEDLQFRDVSISKLKEELQEMRGNVDTTKHELQLFRQHNEKLQSELHDRELSITKLGEDKSHSSRLNSSSTQQHVTHSFAQTEPLQMSDLDPESESANRDEIEEVIGEFEEKIVQMQELHAAEILDMEARHISESESLRRDTQALEDECKALKAVIDKLRSTQVRAGKDSCDSFHTSLLALLTPKNLFALADSSSDYSQRTGFDFPSLQQEFRSTPEGARRETDDPLPDCIKTLLREVHQEGMQVLSLSELPLAEGESGSQFDAPGWLKERDALLATVESLKGLITQMQTHRETQTSGGVDWRAELLDAVRQVFTRERSVLKSALYSQLDLLDISDAIVHLNQLERRLAEQHREAIGSLHTADRSSLISEIHQLRGQLERLHQG
uniref:A-kinase anchoring protein 9 n=1 Tax=Gasterosteus aculeatus aculeatus TaxID=481459 RepID=A0AAQ4P127_GASAC